MKYLIITLSFTIWFSVSFAQVKGILYYKKTIADEPATAPRVENYIVHFANNKSLETVLIPDLKESTVQTGDNIYEKAVSFTGGKKKFFVYKDFGKIELIVAARVHFNIYLVGDTLSTIKWAISNEKMEILKYKCIKATANFRGRNYIAWFTEEVPLPYGPWKFGSLPGLIVKISDNEKIYTYDLEGIDLKTDFDVNIVNVPGSFRNDTPITHTAFMNLYYKKVKELEAQSRASAFVNEKGSGSTKIAMPSKMEKF